MVKKRHVNEGHIVVQDKQLGQPRRIEQLGVRGPASNSKVIVGLPFPTNHWL